jgi:Ca2+/H+ antiporter, TMEM165/GDT1 family
MDLSALLQAFVTVFPAELPDKSMFATLALVTRLRNPKAVWVGVAGAFAVHATVAASVGGLLSRLPERPIAAAAAVMFSMGALLMWREAHRSYGASAGSVEEDVSIGVSKRSFRGIAATSFGVLALAELGDLTQFAVAGLAARTGEPISVGVGGWLATAGVAALAVALGGRLSQKFHLKRLQYGAALIFGVLGVWSAIEAAGISP